MAVDDEAIARENLEFILRKQGYQVQTAGNGLEALAVLAEGEYDLVITDLKMEKMDGLQLIDSIRKQSPRTDIVMVTGYATVDSTVEAFTKGAAYIWQNPSR